MSLASKLGGGRSKNNENKLSNSSVGSSSPLMKEDDPVELAVDQVEKRSRIDNPFGYVRLSSGMWVFIVVTFFIDIFYGFWLVFNTTTTVQLWMNGTLYQVPNSNGSVDIVQIGAGFATLIDMSSVDPTYNESSLSGYLPTNMNYKTYTRMGGAADYFSTTYSSIITDSISFLGHEFGYGGVLEILIPGPPSYMVSSAFFTVLLLLAMAVGYLITFLVQCSENFTSMSAHNANTVLAYISSLFIQISGVLTFLAIMDNGVTDLYCMGFGMAFLAETCRWMSYRYSDTEKAYLNISAGDEITNNHMSYRKSLVNTIFTGSTVYTLYNFVIVIIFALRSQNWGFQGDIGSWPPQYSLMVSSFMKAYIWMFIGGACIVFPFINYVTLCFKTGELITKLAKKAAFKNGENDIEMKDLKSKVSLGAPEKPMDRGLFYQGTHFYVFSEYVMTLMGLTLGLDEGTYLKADRVLFMLTNLYNMAIIFSMSMIINLGTHTNATGVSA